MHQRILPHWPIVTACLFYGILVSPLITMQGVAVGSDGILLFYPVTYAFKQALSAGNLPHWTTGLQAGFPLLADGQPSILYPINVLFLLVFSAPTAYNQLFVFHGFLGLIFTYIWGRTLKNSYLASALMGMLFVFTTPLFAYNLPMMEALTWTPLIFILTEKSLQSKQSKMLWIVGLILGIQWFAGFPQITLYSLVACSVYFAGRLLIERPRWNQRIHWIIGWLAAIILGVLLAAPLLIPTYELSLFSIRANGITGAMVGEKSQFPLAMIAFLIPATKAFWQQAGLGIGIYMGMIPFLVALGTFFKKNKPFWYYPIVAMCGVTAVLAFGRFSPLFPLIRNVPGLSSFRVPSRFLYFTLFGLITLFGWGWDYLFTNGNLKAKQWQERLFKVAIILYVFVSILGYPVFRLLKSQLVSLATDITFNYIVNDSYHLQSQSYYSEKIDTLYQIVLDVLWDWPYTLLLFLILVLGWLFVRWGNLNPSAVKLAKGGLSGLILLDIMMFVGGVKHVAPLSWVTEMPETAVVVKEEIGSKLCRLYAHTDAQIVTSQEDALNLLPSNYHMLWDISGTGLYSPLGFYPYYQLTENIGGVNLAFGLKPINSEAVYINRALLNYLNVCVITSREELTDFTLIERINDVNIYRNEQVLPRAYVVDEVSVLSDEQDVITAVHDNIENIPDLTILQMQLPEKLTPGAAETAQISITTYEDTEVAINAQTEGTVLLQLTDTYYPGWEAYLDGELVETFLANAQFRAVVVPTGNHNITFTFIPKAFYKGLGISLISSVFLVLWAGWFLWQLKLERTEQER